MARILVTGGAGYVGSVCCEELLRQGQEVLVLDDLSTGHRDSVPSGADFQRTDIGDKEALSRLLAGAKIDAVFHFAAKAVVGESVVNPGFYFDENVAKGIVLLEALREQGIKKFVFSSSAAIYGNPSSSGPIPEAHPKTPVNPYGETKLVFEQILRWYAEAYGWNVVAFRYFNACGASKLLGERHRPETHIIPLLLQVASGEREAFDIYGDDYETPDGTCLRDYVHVIDIARAHILALRSGDIGKLRAFNIGLGRSYSVLEVHQAAEKVTGRPIPTRYSKRRPGDPAILCACPDRLVNELGWKPAHADLEEIIRSAWVWKLAQKK